MVNTRIVLIGVAAVLITFFVGITIMQQEPTDGGQSTSDDSSDRVEKEMEGSFKNLDVEVISSDLDNIVVSVENNGNEAILGLVGVIRGKYVINRNCLDKEGITHVYPKMDENYQTTPIAILPHDNIVMSFPPTPVGASRETNTYQLIFSLANYSASSYGSWQYVLNITLHKYAEKADALENCESILLEKNQFPIYYNRTASKFDGNILVRFDDKQHWVFQRSSVHPEAVLPPNKKITIIVKWVARNDIPIPNSFPNPSYFDLMLPDKPYRLNDREAHYANARFVWKISYDFRVHEISVLGETNKPTLRDKLVFKGWDTCEFVALDKWTCPDVSSYAYWYKFDIINTSFKNFETANLTWISFKQSSATNMQFHIATYSKSSSPIDHLTGFNGTVPINELCQRESPETCIYSGFYVRVFAQGVEWELRIEDS